MGRSCICRSRVYLCSGRLSKKKSGKSEVCEEHMCEHFKVVDKIIKRCLNRKINKLVGTEMKTSNYCVWHTCTKDHCLNHKKSGDPYCELHLILPKLEEAKEKNEDEKLTIYKSLLEEL